jgi:hypothetical protein
VLLSVTVSSIIQFVFQFIAFVWIRSVPFYTPVPDDDGGFSGVVPPSWEDTVLFNLSNF